MQLFWQLRCNHSFINDEVFLSAPGKTNNCSNDLHGALALGQIGSWLELTHFGLAAQASYFVPAGESMSGAAGLRFGSLRDAPEKEKQNDQTNTAILLVDDNTSGSAGRVVTNLANTTSNNLRAVRGCRPDSQSCASNSFGKGSRCARPQRHDRPVHQPTSPGDNRTHLQATLQRRTQHMHTHTRRNT